jgi:hypothetical protein
MPSSIFARAADEKPTDSGLATGMGAGAVSVAWAYRPGETSVADRRHARDTREVTRLRRKAFLLGMSTRTPWCPTALNIFSFFLWPNLAVMLSTPRRVPGVRHKLLWSIWAVRRADGIIPPDAVGFSGIESE